MLIHRSLCTLLAALTLLSCDSEPTFDRQAMLASIADVVILPTYQDFQTQSESLRAEIDAFCAAPSEASLQAVYDAFDGAKAVYKQTEAFAFGPAIRSPHRLDPKVDSWPPDVPKVSEQLAETDDFGQEAVDSWGVSRKGMPALEILLWGGDLAEDAREPAAILAAFDADPNRCAYARALGENLAARAAEYVVAWSPAAAVEGGEDFRDALVNADQHDEFSTLFVAASTLVDQLVHTTENLRELKIGKPAGKRNNGRPDLTTIESPYRARSIQDALDSLTGLENVYFGRYGGVQGVGVQDWLVSIDPVTNDAMLASFEETRAALNAIESPLSAAVFDEPEAVEAAYQAIKELQIILATDVASVLGVTVTFNPTDAD